MSAKISILTPVYNGEAYVERFIKSVINQTYSNIELIIIDDGSTDETKNIIQKYIDNGKIHLKYIYQENGGQASAIANGIKYVTGEFLAWADSDDYYENDALEKMVSFLQNNKDADIVRCNAIARDEEDLNNILYYMKVEDEYKNKKDIFEDCIFIRGINCFPGVYMARFKKYKENNPTLYIYEGREGQNWQLLLPVLYKCNCYYLDENVYNYVVRRDSHSHIKRSFDEQIKRLDGVSNVLKSTLSNLKISKSYLNELFSKIDEEYNRNKFLVYCKSGESNKVKEYYKLLKNKKLKDRIAYLVGIIKPLNKLYRVYRKL